MCRWHVGGLPYPQQDTIKRPPGLPLCHEVPRGFKIASDRLIMEKATVEIQKHRDLPSTGCPSRCLQPPRAEQATAGPQTQSESPMWVAGAALCEPSQRHPRADAPSADPGPAPPVSPNALPPHLGQGARGRGLSPFVPECESVQTNQSKCQTRKIKERLSH